MVTKTVGGIFIATSFVVAATVHVTPEGKAENSGGTFASAVDCMTALSRATAGDTILLQGGTYAIPYTAAQKNTIVISKSGSAGKPICMLADKNSRALFNFSYPDNSKVLNADVTSIGFEITGSYWYFRGISITKAGYQGAYVTGSHCTFDNCSFYENWNSGLEINKGGSYITVVNCDSYRNFDGAYKGGGMADGFASKQTQGPGNKFTGCRAWENSDDGFDTYDSPESVIIDQCWVFRNGVNVWGFDGFVGNGNGFKIGGNSKVQNNTVTRSVAFGHPGKGFDQNNNTGGQTIYNCLAYANGTNFGLGGTLASGQSHTLVNNLSISGTVTVKNATEKNNSWNDGYAATSGEVKSLDTSLARAPRTADGSLPENELFRPKAGGGLVDKGVDVGLPFTGLSPDIGCFESTVTVSLAKAPLQHQSLTRLTVTRQGNTLMLHSPEATGAPVVEVISCSGKRTVYTSGLGMPLVLVDGARLAPGAYIARVTGQGYRAAAAFIW